MAGEHICACDHCTALAKAGQLMCLPCWRATPTHLQRAVNRAWRNYRYDQETYREAREEAVAYHRNRPGTQASLL